MPRLLLDTQCFLEVARGSTPQEAWFEARSQEADFDGGFVSAVTLSQLEMSLARELNNGGILGSRFRLLAGAFAANNLVVPYEHAHHDRCAALASLPLVVNDAAGKPKNMPPFDRMVAAVALAGQFARPFVLATPLIQPAHQQLQAAGLIVEEAS